MTSLLLLALVPIAILIAMGTWLRQSGFLQESFWPQAEKLGYYVLLPALFFHSLATAELGDVPVRKMMLTLVLSILVVAALLLLLRPLFKLDGPAFTSLFQGGLRLIIMWACRPQRGCLARRALRWRRWPTRR